MNENYAIKVEGLTKKYKKNKKDCKEVFNNFTINFEEEKIHCILGVSGCGKSSLLRIIAGVEEYESGTVILRDDITSNQKIPLAMVLQENNLLPWLSVSQNVEFALKAKKDEKIKENLKNILRKHGLYDIRDFYPHELSVGLKQKVSLAKTFAIKPKIILLDEPFCALDFISKEKIHNIFIDEFQREKFTAILSTHYIEEAIKLGDYIHLLGKNNNYIKIKNPLSFPRECDKNYNKFLDYIKEIYI